MKFIADKLRAYSPTFSPTIYKAVLVTIVLGAFAFPLGLVALPYIEFFNGMAVQPKGLAQGVYGRLYGKELPVERLPVPGTIPQGYRPYPFEGNDDKTAELAGLKLVNPAPRTLPQLRRGQKIYNIYCITCHGKTGLGDGPVVGPDRFPAPTSLHTDAVKKYPDGQIFHIITRGKGKMPGYADRITPEDRWAVVHFVHALHRALDPKPEDLKE